MDTATLDNISIAVRDGLGVLAETAFEWEWELIDDTSLLSVNPDYIITIPIETPKFDFDLALTIAESDAARMAHKLLMFEDDEELPDDVNLADSVCEITNIGAGEIKKILYQSMNSVAIGIPKLCDQSEQFGQASSTTSGPNFLMRLGPTLICVDLSNQQNKHTN